MLDRDALKDAVLHTLDTIVHKQTGGKLPIGQSGAYDKDLPVLFDALDAHFDILDHRYAELTATRRTDEFIGICECYGMSVGALDDVGIICDVCYAR